ncbi:hypothetical protein ASPCADRAFT_409020 [Aspergillus carbonarius ITEM 5010]|uniref:Uncharacterized protein n=1 Tax=Aspergillus carbonarius (strain ITEM 5010) TaxID=602072 RepID=A0A1R3RBR8_ASPC5|nr:hypothetical protein ASPCADRAFT_409020 [Aspergillus carbonarius ITEM 5010]
MSTTDFDNPVGDIRTEGTPQRPSRPAIGIFGLPGSGKSYLLEKPKGEIKAGSVLFRDTDAPTKVESVSSVYQEPPLGNYHQKLHTAEGVRQHKSLADIEKEFQNFTHVVYLAVPPETFFSISQNQYTYAEGIDQGH